MNILLAHLALYGSLLAAFIFLVEGIGRRAPGDVSSAVLGLVEVFLILQTIVSVIAIVQGKSAASSNLEYLIYVFATVLIPLIAFGWSLIEHNRWSSFILVATSLAIAVLQFRFAQVWFGDYRVMLSFV